jgi:hypothetical protein
MIFPRSGLIRIVVFSLLPTRHVQRKHKLVFVGRVVVVVVVVVLIRLAIPLLVGRYNISVIGELGVILQLSR